LPLSGQNNQAESEKTRSCAKTVQPDTIKRLEGERADNDELQMKLNQLKSSLSSVRVAPVTPKGTLCANLATLVLLALGLFWYAGT